MVKTTADLADHLAAIRAEIRTLKAVEEDLRTALLAHPGRVVGHRFVAISEAKRTRRFDPKLLPQLTYQDPQFWTTKVTKIVRVFPKDQTGPRPEGRARSTAATGQACQAGTPRPPQAAVRHIVPDDIGPEMYRMADDFWDRL